MPISQTPGTWLLACHSAWQHAASASAAECTAPLRCERRIRPSQKQPGDPPHVPSWRADPAPVRKRTAGHDARESDALSEDLAESLGTSCGCSPCPGAPCHNACADDLCPFEEHALHRARPPRSCCHRVALLRAPERAGGTCRRTPGESWCSARLGFCPALACPPRNASARLQRPLFGRRFACAPRMGMCPHRASAMYDAGAVNGATLPLHDSATIYAGVGLARQLLKEALPPALFVPSRPSARAGGRQAIALWQSAPGRTGSGNPEDAVEPRTMVLVGAPWLAAL